MHRNPTQTFYDRECCKKKKITINNNNSNNNNNNNNNKLFKRARDGALCPIT